MIKILIVLTNLLENRSSTCVGGSTLDLCRE